MLKSIGELLQTEGPRGASIDGMLKSIGEILHSGTPRGSSIDGPRGASIDGMLKSIGELLQTEGPRGTSIDGMLKLIGEILNKDNPKNKAAPGDQSSLGFSSAAQQRSKTDVGSNVFSYADAAAYSSNASQAIKKSIINEDTGKPYTHRQLVNSSKAIVKSIKNGEPIVYNLQRRTRKQRLQPRLENTLATVAKEYGVSVLVTSGGQPARYQMANGQLSPKSTRDRTGGHRHDGGGAGDVEFVTREGRALSLHNTDDRVIMANIITSLVAKGVNGVGAGPGYMGSTGAKVHIGGGSGTHWNKSTRGGTGDPWLRAAWEKGMALRKSGGNWKPKRLASKD